MKPDVFASEFPLFFFCALRSAFQLENSQSMGLVHYLWDSQTYLFNNFFIKNGSHDTIYIFKNDFVIVFSVFSFQQYPNGPLIYNT